MALQINSNSVDFNQQRVSELFEELQLELDKQKQTLLHLIKNQTKIAINQQKYHHIINHLKDLVTISTTDDLSPDQDTIQPLSTQRNDQNIMQIHSMDHLSAWLKNKQLWQFIDKQNAKSMQNEIIQNLFTDFSGLMKHLLEHKYNLSALQQNQLCNILLNYSSNSHDIFHNYRPKDDGITITSIPDHCLSYIMQFLTQNNRYVVQRTCRLFTIAIRQDGAVNDIKDDFTSMYMVPNLRKMIDGIASNDKDKNEQALQLFAKNMDNKGLRWILRSKIKYFDDEIWNKFMDLVLANNSELNTKICLFLFDMGVCREMTSMAMKYLKDMKEITGPNAYDAIDDVYQIDCSSAVRRLGYIVNNFIYHPDIVPTLLHILQEIDNYQYKESYHKTSLLSSIYSCIYEVSKFGLIAVNQLLVDEGYMDVIQKYLAQNAASYSSQTLWKTLNGFLDTPGLITVDELLNKYHLFDYAVNYPDYSWMFVMKICEMGTHEQRMRVIEGMLDKNRINRMSKKKRRCQKILNILKKNGDMLAHSRLSEYIFTT